jgi:hypothetical protein
MLRNTFKMLGGVRIAGKMNMSRLISRIWEDRKTASYLPKRRQYARRSDTNTGNICKDKPLRRDKTKRPAYHSGPLCLFKPIRR